MFEIMLIHIDKRGPGEKFEILPPDTMFSKNIA